MSALAARLGFDAQAAWAHEKNAGLRARRPSMDMLCPGDVVHIPQEPSEALELSVGTTNQFSARIPTVTIRLALRLGDHVLANEEYEIAGIPGPSSTRGRSDGDGVVKLDLPVSVRSIDLLLPRLHATYAVDVGHLEPAEEMSGIRQRLKHLRYYPGAARSGAPDLERDHDRLAIEAFQRHHGIEPTGELDARTRDAIVSAHGA